MGILKIILIGLLAASVFAFAENINTRDKRFINPMDWFTEGPRIMTNYPIYKIRKYSGYQISPIAQNVQTVLTPSVVDPVDNKTVATNILPLVESIKSTITNSDTLRQVKLILQLLKSENGLRSLYGLITSGILPTLFSSATEEVDSSEDQSFETLAPQNIPIEYVRAPATVTLVNNQNVQPSALAVEQPAVAVQPTGETYSYGYTTTHAQSSGPLNVQAVPASVPTDASSAIFANSYPITYQGLGDGIIVADPPSAGTYTDLGNGAFIVAYSGDEQTGITAGQIKQDAVVNNIVIENQGIPGYIYQHGDIVKANSILDDRYNSDFTSQTNPSESESNGHQYSYHVDIPGARTDYVAQGSNIIENVMVSNNTTIPNTLTNSTNITNNSTDT